MSSEHNASAPGATLKKVLKPIHLWAIAVGLVISGEYFGWNYGWGVSGTVGFLIATLLVTLMYVTFIFSFTELTTSIPQAGGPFSYSQRAFGWFGGLIAGYATLVEFLVTPPAIAFALGSYTHFLYPSLGVLDVAFACYVIFILINLLGIKESAMFSLVVTLLAVGELLIYIGIVAPHFSYKTFVTEPMPFGWPGVFAALPFAIWFYLAIEGVAMVAEEVEDPKRTISRGYIYGILTLVVLALAVMVFTGGVAHWRLLSEIDYPLPAALGIVLGRDSALTQLFASLGLFGLIASFHGTIIGYSRQIYALARAGLLPSFLGNVNARFQTPHWALIGGGIVGCIALKLGTTDQVIILAALGAVVMYIISMVALFMLRRNEPGLERPFIVPAYPYFPLIALILSVVCLIAIIYYNLVLSLWFFSGLVLVTVLYMATGRHKVSKHIDSATGN
ncbi:ethanolamine permease [Dyadobacter chenwenxiniae]|uniref:Ethanolamine permease n=1 Tax=Dyadobacter chenwenxiniae TaxID=2906456 RepID=A0A9X1PIQ1_9BACT|nr:ethanolamine permease [Dyadobacter chenwenxiniae]MCF0061070.1 ethanolamine permease [Dyadobacter chenwenxiniae]UON80897.1 ethanolamine permease [Dyadobacter chenwenxiniae]